MIREILCAIEALLFRSVPDEQDGALGLARLSKRLGDLEREHGSAAIVVRAVVDRVETRWSYAMQAVDEVCDSFGFVWSRSARTVVGPALPGDAIEGADGIVI